MAENRFDALLRDALLDANWLECRTVWEEAEEPDFSPTYLRWRRNLLADPFGFVKRKLRPVWVRALRMAACIVLACAVTLGTLMAVSPTVRAAVLNWLREISGNYMTYTSGQTAQTDALPSNWRVTWLPEGWELWELSSNSQIYEEPSSQGGLTFACAPPGDSQMATNVYDVEDADVVRSTIQVQGADADYYESEGYRVLLWENEAGFLFLLRNTGGLAEEDFLKVAESVSYYEGSGTAYVLDWASEDYEPLNRYELIGACTEEWINDADQVLLTWQYITDPVCSFATPEGEPEEIPLGNGVTAQYWAAAESFQGEPATVIINGEEMELDGSTITVNGFTITVGTDPGEASSSTLLWTGPDSDTTFLLQGILSRENLLDMARSLREVPANPSPPSHNILFSEGTAGG